MTGIPVNRFIAALAAPDRALLAPQLKSFALVHGRQLQEQGERIEYVYFPLGGIVSLLTIMADGRAVEAAMTGSSGGVDLAAGLGQMRATSRSLVQASGPALRMVAGSFHRLTRQSSGLTARIVAQQESLLGQVQQTAACNGLHDAGRRLARWLLQAHDLVGDGETIPFTQEFLSSMLGVRRTTVTAVAGALQTAGLITYRRGRIQVLDRAALEDAACECYGVVRALTARSGAEARARRS